jgi:hypothetical protein
VVPQAAGRAAGGRGARRGDIFGPGAAVTERERQAGGVHPQGVGLPARYSIHSPSLLSHGAQSGLAADASDRLSAPPHAAPAHQLGPQQRCHLAVLALAGSCTITQLADEHHVSRKFVYQVVDTADRALHRAFAAAPDDRVLFYLPVTKAWLRQVVLVLVFYCHSSFRGVMEALRDLFDYDISLGTVHNIVRAAVPAARRHNLGQDLAAVGIGAHDEIFQAGMPVLAGCDAETTYCYLLSPEEHRDADTWAVRLLELTDRGFAPRATVADGGQALRAGQEVALPGVPCRGDVFHIQFEELGPLLRAAESRAYKAIEARSKLERQLATPGKRRDKNKLSLIGKLRYAREEEAEALGLAEDVAVLVRWLREDILAVAGPDHAVRLELYDFVVAELRARQGRWEHRLRPVCVALENQRAVLLAFAAQLDEDLAAVARGCQVSVSLAREALHVQALSPRDVRRGPREAALWQALGGRYQRLRAAVVALAGSVVRASSVVENLNSRLRNYFFLRREVGPDYLALLQFFLNHHRFQRSARRERVGKSPAELLSGQAQPHWLELLGYTRFRRQQGPAA